MKNLFTFITILLGFTLLASAQKDTTQLNTYIGVNFPDNTSGFITPLRLRNVAKELNRSGANKLERNYFAETIEVGDTVKSEQGFFKWNGSGWTEVGSLSDTAIWARSGGFILPKEYSDTLTIEAIRVESVLYPNGIANIGKVGFPFDTLYVNQIIGGNTDHNTLDEAYDEGGAGLGRVITADAGAVEINGPISVVNDGVMLVNDSVNIPSLGYTQLSGAYHFSGSNINTSAYFPNGFGTTIPVNVIRMTQGDSISTFNMFSKPNNIGQLFTLQTSIGKGYNGYETQVDAGLNRTKMFATSYDGLTNLSVIEVDTIGVQIYSDNYGKMVRLSGTGLQISDGTQSDGYVLKSDASGNASWQPPCSNGVSYVDTTHNASSPYSVSATTTTRLPFRWDVSPINNLPASIDSLFNRNDTTIIGKNGRWMDLTLYFKATPSANNQWMDIWMDLGGSVGEIYRETFAFPKGMSVDRSIIYSLASIYNGSTWESNGAKVYIYSSHPLTIQDMILNIDL